MSHFEQMRNAYRSIPVGAPVGVGAAWVRTRCLVSPALLAATWQGHGRPNSFTFNLAGHAYRVDAVNGNFECFMWTTPNRLAPKTALAGVTHVGAPDAPVGGHNALANPSGRQVIDAAEALLTYFDTNPCSQASLPAVSAFQTAYSTSGLPGNVSIDGKYGGNTQKALDNTIGQSQADANHLDVTQQAPTNCFGMVVPDVPATNPPVSVTPANPATPGTTTNTTTTTTVIKPTPWGTIALVAAAVAATGLVGYSVAKKKGFTLKRHTGHGHRALHHRYA
jgi:hypothetical protein